MRNFKVLGLAFVAVLAMCAGMASVASANTATWSHESLLGHKSTGEGVKNEFTGAAGVACLTATYDQISKSGSELELTPTFSNCLGSNGLLVTITHNGCQYVLTLGTTEDHTAPVTPTLSCPGENRIIVHFYTDAKHTQNDCTFEIGTQHNLSPLTAHNITASTHVRITGEITGIVNYADGPCIGGVTTQIPNAALHVDITLTNSGLTAP